MNANLLRAVTLPQDQMLLGVLVSRGAACYGERES